MRVIEPTGDKTGQTDTDDIQQALNAKAARPRWMFWGRRVKLGPGSFYIDRPLDLSCRKGLRGA